MRAGFGADLAAGAEEGHCVAERLVGAEERGGGAVEGLGGVEDVGVGFVAEFGREGEEGEGVFAGTFAFGRTRRDDGCWCEWRGIW